MLQILSLNVWFDLKLREVRTRALLDVIRTCQPSICCFQEVVPEVAVQLMAGLPGWSSSDVDRDGSSVKPYGVLILVRPGLTASFSLHDLPSNMCRRLAIAEVSDLAIATVHLESLSNHPIREAQLQRCAEALGRFQDAILVGDFNFDSERNFKPPHDPLENLALATYLPGFVDVWTALRPSERGFTFDSTANTYIGPFEQMRYDRVMAKLQRWQAASIELVGDLPVDDLVELSVVEQELLERPPTPPRPSFKPRAFPDSFGDDDTVGCGGGGTVKRGREESPPPRKKGLFLSDHFGLLSRLQPLPGAYQDLA